MKSVELEFRRADGFTFDDLVATLNRCFEGYLVAIHLDRSTLVSSVRANSVDLTASVVACHDGRPMGVALVARRGWSCRLAAMAIEPQFRGRRIGARLTDHLILAARDRHDREFVLECIEQNAPAVRLYQSAGFATVRRLAGYTAEDLTPDLDPTLEEIDPATVSAAVSVWGMPNLPWQMAPQTLAALNPPHCAFQLGGASAIITNPAEKPVTICALVVDPAVRRQGRGTRLVRALAARFPARQWRFSILVPEEWPETFFLRLGFRKESLRQLQMARAL